MPPPYASRIRRIRHAHGTGLAVRRCSARALALSHPTMRIAPYASRPETLRFEQAPLDRRAQMAAADFIQGLNEIQSLNDPRERWQD